MKKPGRCRAFSWARAGLSARSVPQMCIRDREHTERGPLDKMMKPGIGTYDRFKQMFEKFSKEAGKEQYLIPYFIAAHPGTTDEDMMNLALWLKRNGFRADQVQAFYPSPMATATAMYHSGKNLSLIHISSPPAWIFHSTSGSSSTPACTAWASILPRCAPGMRACATILVCAS